jgi:transposase
MPAPHPIELRRAAVAAYDAGEGTAAAVAERFGVGERTLREWSKQLRSRGTLEPAPRGGGNFSDVDIDVLMAVLVAHRDATTEELTRAYNAKRPRSRRVSRSSVLRALKREGFVFKKNARGPQSRIGPMSERSGRSSSAG